MAVTSYYYYDCCYQFHQLGVLAVGRQTRLEKVCRAHLVSRILLQRLMGPPEPPRPAHGNIQPATRDYGAPGPDGHRDNIGMVENEWKLLLRV